MLREYAVEPELVATWSARTTARYFRDQFGLGSPRIISKYPGAWRKLVWAAWKRNANGGDTERKRMEELLAHLSGTMAKRPTSIWRPDSAWPGNALGEHRRLAFQAILARENPGDEPRVLVPEDLDDSILWNLERGRVIPRRAAAMAEALQGMLRLAEKVVFVDPYFAPANPRYLRVLSACLEACRAARHAHGRSPGVHIITSGGRDKDPSASHFKAECHRKLPVRLPVDQPVTIRRVAERPNGQQLHNRYVLTEHGGVSFGAGLDEKRGNSTDDLLLLPREPYLQRWREYADDSTAFDRVGDDFTILGQRAAISDR